MYSFLLPNKGGGILAETIRGINVVISGETTGLSKALSDVEKKSRGIQSELKQVEKLLKLDPTNTQLVAQKQQLLAQAVENTREKLTRLKSVQEQVNEQFRRGEISEGQYRAFQREVIKTEQELQKLEKQLSEVTGEVKEQGEQVSRLGKEYQEAFEEAKQSLGNAYEQTKKVGAAITAAGAAITAGLGVVVGKAADFEQAMANVYSVMAPDEVAQFRDELENLAITMGAETKYSATEAARGIEELVKAGVSVQDILEGGLAGALSLATAGELELADAAEIASTALNAFRADAISVQEAADILAGAANASATSVGELKYGLSQVSAVASGVGLSFKDTVTALAVFAQNGLKGSDAGTSLKTMLMRLQPSTKQAAETMAELGIITEDGTNKFIDANGQFKSLAEIAGVLRESLSGLTDAQRLAALETMFGSDAIRAANILYKEGAEGVEAMAEAMGKISAAEVAAQKMDTFKGAMEELSGALETAQISIGNALLPALRVLVSGIQRVVDAFNSLPPGVQSAIAMFGALAAGLALVAGPMLLLIGFLPQIAAGFSMIVPVMSTVGAVIGGIAAPVGIAIAAIGALAGAAFLIIKNWEPIKEFFVNLWDGIVSVTSAAWEGIKTGLSSAWEAIKSTTTSVFEGISAFFTDVWNGIVSFLTETWNGLTNTAKSAFEGILKVIKPILEGYKTFFSGIWETIKNIFAGALLLIVDLVTGDFENLKKDAEAIWNNLKDSFSTIWDGIKQIFIAALDIIIKALSAAWNAITTAASTAWNGIKTTISNIVSATVTWIKDTWNTLLSWFRELPGKLYTIGSDMFNRMREAVTTTVTRVKDAIVAGISAAIDWLRRLPSELLQIGKDIIQGLINGIKSMVGEVGRAIKSVADKVTKGLRDFLDIRSPSRVMMQLGEYTGEGFAEGIGRSIAAVRQKTAEMAAAASNVMTGVNSPAVAMQGGGGVESRIINFERMFAGANFYVRNDTDIQRIARELFNLQQQAARGRGLVR